MIKRGKNVSFAVSIKKNFLRKNLETNLDDGTTKALQSLDKMEVDQFIYIVDSISKTFIYERKSCVCFSVVSSV